MANKQICSTKSLVSITLILLLAIVIGIKLNFERSHAMPSPAAIAAGKPFKKSLVEISNAPAQIKIEGLFGVKLGAPLPQSCLIISTSDVAGKFITKDIVPPETNSTFSYYLVYLDPSGRFVSMIEGQSKSYDDYSEYKNSLDGIVSKLRERYGKESADNSLGMNWYYWSQGNRDVTLTDRPKIHQFDVSATDEDLNHPVSTNASAVDTRGL